MRRKVMSSLLAITLLFSLPACGNNEPDVAALEDSISTEFVTIEQTESSEQTAPTEQAVAKKNEVNKESEPLKNTESTSPTEESKKESVTPESTESSSKDKDTKQSTTTTATEKENKTKDKTNNKPNTTTADKPSGESSKPSESTSVSSKPSENTPESNESKPQTKPDSQPSQPNQETPTPQVHTCNFGNGIVTTAATCTNDGVRTYTCSCGATKTEAIPAIGHKMTTDTTPATCTVAGKTKTYCTVCGYVESESSNGAATGHSWGELSWFIPQTCTYGGYYNRACTVCGAADGGEGEPLGHSWDNGVDDINCFGGIRTYTCTVCGDKRTEEISGSGNHVWVDDGEFCRKCTICGLVEDK